MNELKQKLLIYGDYLDDIRKRVFKIVIVFLIFFIIGFFATGPILSLIISIFKVKEVTIVTNSPFQFVDLSMTIGMFLAFTVCVPLVVYHIYAFLKDGLRSKEKSFFLLILPVALCLFLIGFGYGFVIMYYCLGLMANININLGIVNLWDIDKYLSQIVITSALLGILFEFPLVLIFMNKIGLINQAFLKQKRRVAYALIFILVSLLPPTDGLSLIIMSVPLCLVYELTLIANNFINKEVLIN